MLVSSTSIRHIFCRSSRQSDHFFFLAMTVVEQSQFSLPTDSGASSESEGSAPLKTSNHIHDPPMD